MRPTNRARPIVAVVLTLALAFTAGCSSDKKDDAKDKTTTTKGASSDKEFCDAARASQNLPTSQALEGAEKQAAVAPKELEAQFARLVEVLKFGTDNPDQQAEFNAKMTAANKDLRDIIDYSTTHCGITFDFGG